MNEALITSLEQAGEGSRELDALIWCAVRGHTFVRLTDADRALLFVPQAGRGIKRESCFAPVTTSIDAALALAERVLGDKASVWQIVRFFDRHSVQFGDHLSLPSGEGTTAPLAACIAILRATHQETT